MNRTLLLLPLFSLLSCEAQPEAEPYEPPPVLPVEVWTTSGDGVNLLYKKTIDFAADEDERFPAIQIAPDQQFQAVEGFGYTLTGGSAMLLHRMAAPDRAALLQELFGKGDNSIGVSYLRVSIGASDLDPVVFSYNDRPAGMQVVFYLATLFVVGGLMRVFNTPTPQPQRVAA